MAPLGLKNLTKPDSSYGILSYVLNAFSNKTYEYITDILTEVSELFPDQYIHIGGDEVQRTYWDLDESIQLEAKSRGLNDDHSIQYYFTQKVFQILEKLKKKPMGWQEIFSPNFNFSSFTILQGWHGLGPEAIAETEYPMVYSRDYYLDWIQAPCYYWEKRMLYSKNLIGGEACVWSEYFEPANHHALVYPNLAVMAENFWANLGEMEDPCPTDKLYPQLKELYLRIDRINWFLENIGIDLRHRSAYESQMKEISSEKDYLPVMIIANLLRSHTRVGSSGYSAETKLNQLIDYLYPDSITARKFSEILREIYIEKGVSAIRRKRLLEEVKGYLNDWILASDEVLKGENAFIELEGNIPLKYFSPPLKELAQCSLESLRNIEENSWKLDEKCSRTARHYCGHIQGKAFLDICDILSRIIHNSVRTGYVPSECKGNRKASRAIFQLFDSDNSKKLQREEFKALISTLSSSEHDMNEDRVDHLTSVVFDTYCKNKEEGLTLDEFTKAVNSTKELEHLLTSL